MHRSADCAVKTVTTTAASRHATDAEVFDLSLRTYSHHKHLGHGKAMNATMAWAMLYAATWRKPEILAGPLHLDRLARGADELILVWAQAYVLDRHICPLLLSVRTDKRHEGGAKFFSVRIPRRVPCRTHTATSLSCARPTTTIATTRRPIPTACGRWPSGSSKSLTPTRKRPPKCWPT